MNKQYINFPIKLMFAVLVFFLMPTLQSLGQVWYDNYVAGLKKSEADGKPIFIVFESPGEFKRCPAIQSSEFKKYAKKELVCVFVKVRYTPSGVQPIGPKSEAVMEEFDQGSWGAVLYNPKTKKKTKIGIWGSNPKAFVKRLQDAVGKPINDD